MLNITFQKDESISKTIEKNQQQFKLLLERLIDRGDPMVVLVKGSLKVIRVEMKSEIEGIAYISFQAKSISGCHGVDSFDEHKTKLAFKINKNALIFNIVLPPAWTFDY